MKQISQAIAVVCLLLSSLLSQAQQNVATSSNVVVPPLVSFSGTLTDVNGKPLTGIVGVTFYLYQQQQGGAPLWIETQNVQPDANGQYSVMLGSTTSSGLPANLFVGGEARWLGVQAQGQAEQPRVMLLSVPYAMKAGDAQTVGGLPVSAFMLAGAANSAAALSSSASTNGSSSGSPAEPNTTSDVTTTGGTAGEIAAFSTATNIQNSLLSQTGTTAINVKGALNLPATGTATSSGGKNSQPQTLVTSVFNSSTAAAVAQTFQWQSEPVGNDTSNPSGTLNLLFGSGTSKPAETGLHVASNGQITFATGQTFPGTGSGTITGVTAGSDLTGGGTTGNVTLNLDITKVPLLAAANVFSASQTVNGTMTATSFSGNGSGLTNVTAANSNQLGGLPASAFAQLSAANTFTGNQGITGNLTDTGNITATGTIAASNGMSTTGVNTGINVTATATVNPVGVNAVTSYGTAVQGQDLGNGPTSTGVLGLSGSPTGIGVVGEATYYSSAATNIGVYGVSSGPSPSGSFTYPIGVEGAAIGAGGLGSFFIAGPSGEVGDIGTSGGVGVLGYGGNDNGSGTLAEGGGSGGVMLGGYSKNGIGGLGFYAQGGSGLTSAGDGADFTGGAAASGVAGNGIYSTAGQGAGFGPDGYPIAGVAGLGPINSSRVTDGPGVFGNDGTLSATGGSYVGLDVGVWGDAGNGNLGVFGTGDNATAVFAVNNSTSFAAVNAQNGSSSSTAQAFVASINSAGGGAVIGGDGCGGTMGLQLGFGILSSNCENYTLQGDNSGNTYLNGSSAGKVVFRINNVTPSPMILNNNGSVTITSLDVTSSLTKPAGSFKIDDPLDPANKYLYHSFVESPDMKNIYDGNITTDGEGIATVILPDWFEALNRDFRYQLTVIGQFAQAIIAHKIEHNKFQIKTSLPNVEVSWQVTGIRHDAFADAHRIPTEVDKAADRGHYLHPELFGAPETARIGYEAPSKLAPVQDKSVSASAGKGPVTRRARMLPRLPKPVLPKLPQVKTPAKQTITQASK